MWVKRAVYKEFVSANSSALVQLSDQSAELGDYCHFNIRYRDQDGGFNSGRIRVAPDKRPQSTTWGTSISASTQPASIAVPTKSEPQTATVTTTMAQATTAPAETGQGNRDDGGAGSNSSYKTALLGVGAAVGALSLIGLSVWFLLRKRRRRRKFLKEMNSGTNDQVRPSPQAEYRAEMSVTGHETWVSRSELDSSTARESHDDKRLPPPRELALVA